MDPDVALHQLRELSKAIDGFDTESAERAFENGHIGAGLGALCNIAGLAEDLASTIDGLDQWLSSRGFLPADWQRYQDGQYDLPIESVEIHYRDGDIGAHPATREDRTAAAALIGRFVPLRFAQLAALRVVFAARPTPEERRELAADREIDRRKDDELTNDAQAARREGDDR